MIRSPLAALLLFSVPAQASDCFQFAERDVPRIHRAAFELEDAQVGIRYIAHSTYLIVTHEGLRILTDWSGDFSHRIEQTPDVITMNHAHETHWTAYPDPEIEHALKGWGSGGKPAEHRLQLSETLIRNVPTDIRSYGGEPFGNSIFVFEHAGLCIGHLGHLHHEPTEEQYAALGRLDVVMAPVDGTFTLDMEGMLRVLKRLRAQVVLPMHAFGMGTLATFLKGMKEGGFEIDFNEDNDLVLSMKILPDVPTVIVPKGM